MAKSLYGSIYGNPGLVTVHYVQSKPWGTSYGSLKVHSPSFMSEIPMGLAKILSPVSLSSSIFCNSKECAITPMKQVVPQNYKTMNPPAGGSFRMPHMNFGASIEAQSGSRDCQSIRATLNVDNSTLRP